MGRNLEIDVASGSCGEKEGGGRVVLDQGEMGVLDNFPQISYRSGSFLRGKREGEVEVGCLTTSQIRPLST